MKGRGAPCGQYISNKRPSRFVILSETKDLARRTEILRFTQDDTPETASFDWQHVLFEMYCPLRVPWLRAGVPFGSHAPMLFCYRANFFPCTFETEFLDSFVQPISGRPVVNFFAGFDQE